MDPTVFVVMHLCDSEGTVINYFPDLTAVLVHVIYTRVRVNCTV